jgi:TPP-dependent pyruvate/acetoin dehydrogenase alpha subunit
VKLIPKQKVTTESRTCSGRVLNKLSTPADKQVIFSGVKHKEIYMNVERDLLIRMYRQMLTIRHFEEAIEDVYKRGLMPGLAHLYIGEEAVAVGVCAALEPKDYITSTHRGHGHCIAKGCRLNEMMAEVMGKVDGYCRGKGGSMHIADFEVGMLGASGIVGGMIGVAAGAALSIKLRGTDQVAVCFFGDGASNQGALYETMNMAALWKTPLIYVCENNQFGEYSPWREVTSCERISSIADHYCMPGVTVDGMDVLAVYEAATAAVARARSGLGPSFIETVTYRYRGHHVGDVKPKYRTEQELEEWKGRDTIARLGARLLETGVASEQELAAVEQQVEREIAECVEFGKNSPLPPVEEVFEHVYA